MDPMIAIELDDSSFKALGLCDAQLVQFAWADSGRNLQIHLITANGKPIELVCSWANRLQMSLSFPENHGGYPLLWDATLLPAAGNWQLALDFSGHGQIALACSSVFLRA